MKVASSELNQRLANSVELSAAADQFTISGKAAFWRLAATGAIVGGLGVAAGIAFFGYASIVHKDSTLKTFTSALSKALASVELKGVAEGTVQVENNQLSLASNQQVILDSQSKIFLDPSARIIIDGEVTLQGPTVSSSPQSSSKTQLATPTITNFTVFKSVPFERGTVLTGWNFLTSAQTSPTDQYCYYSEKSDTPGRNVSIDIATDGKVDAPKTLPTAFNVEEAFGKCVWFRKDAQ